MALASLARTLLRVGTHQRDTLMLRPPPLLLLATTACLLVTCGRGFDDTSRALGEPVDSLAEGRVEIHRPPTLGVVDTPLTDVHGAPIGIACATCHGPDPDGEVLAEARDNPEEMHASVVLDHGRLSCNGCHDADDRRFLHLADGTRLELVEAMDLCAQCHGVQFRDYSAGSHGGMRGAWDLRRGDRSRNHCLDCHGAHKPAWPQLQPVFPPQDRGTVQARAAGSPHEESH